MNSKKVTNDMLRDTANTNVILLLVLVSVSVLSAEHGDFISELTTVQGGLVVHVGCGDGKRTAQLHVNDRYLVHGLDTSEEMVETARAYLRSKKLYGRISVDTFDGQHLPYKENLVNLLVADQLGAVSMAEVIRVLAPLGVAYINGKRTVKPWPGTIDEWTHYLFKVMSGTRQTDRVNGISKGLNQGR